MSKLKAWEQVKKQFPKLTSVGLSPYEKQQVMNSKPTAMIGFNGCYFILHMDGTYEKKLTPKITNLKSSNLLQQTGEKRQ